jgi:hypothetical protein
MRNMVEGCPANEGAAPLLLGFAPPPPLVG